MYSRTIAAKKVVDSERAEKVNKGSKNVTKSFPTGEPAEKILKYVEGSYVYYKAEL